MDTPLIVNITESSDLVYHVKNGESWNGYFIVSGDRSMDIAISIILDGAHADASIRMLNLLSGDASVKVRTVQHHKAKNARSNLLIKTVVSGNASFVFDGSIFVDKNADKTDAYQRNENLILSEGAMAVSRPTLEILASDVRCTHGAATGEIPSDQLWYLKTRGLSQKQAETVYVRGFLNSVLTGLGPDMSETIMHRIMDV